MSSLYWSLARRPPACRSATAASRCGGATWSLWSSTRSLAWTSTSRSRSTTSRATNSRATGRTGQALLAAHDALPDAQTRWGGRRDERHQPQDTSGPCARAAPHQPRGRVVQLVAASAAEQWEASHTRGARPRDGKSVRYRDGSLGTTKRGHLLRGAHWAHDSDRSAQGAPVPAPATPQGARAALPTVPYPPRRRQFISPAL
eukprot:6797711-Prymnesium_polylepis.2